MSRPIKKGDVVDIFYSGDGDDLIGMTVLSTPQDTGDMWYVTDGECHYAINPCSHSLVLIRHRFAFDPAPASDGDAADTGE